MTSANHRGAANRSREGPRDVLLAGQGRKGRRRKLPGTVSVLTRGHYIGGQQVVPVDAVIEDGFVEEAHCIGCSAFLGSWPFVFMVASFWSSLFLLLPCWR